MKIELNENELSKLICANLHKLLPLDITGYEVEMELISAYHSRNPGGLEITLTWRGVEPVPVKEAA